MAGYLKTLLNTQCVLSKMAELNQVSLEKSLILVTNKYLTREHDHIVQYKHLHDDEHNIVFKDELPVKPYLNDITLSRTENFIRAGEHEIKQKQKQLAIRYDITIATYTELFKKTIQHEPFITRETIKDFDFKTELLRQLLMLENTCLCLRKNCPCTVAIRYTMGLVSKLQVNSIKSSGLYKTYLVKAHYEFLCICEGTKIINLVCHELFAYRTIKQTEKIKQTREYDFRHRSLIKGELSGRIPPTQDSEYDKTNFGTLDDKEFSDFSDVVYNAHKIGNYAHYIKDEDVNKVPLIKVPKHMIATYDDKLDSIYALHYTKSYIYVYMFEQGDVILRKFSSNMDASSTNNVMLSYNNKRANMMILQKYKTFTSTFKHRIDLDDPEKYINEAKVFTWYKYYILPTANVMIYQNIYGGKLVLKTKNTQRVLPNDLLEDNEKITELIVDCAKYAYYEILEYLPPVLASISHEYLVTYYNWWDLVNTYTKT